MAKKKPETEASGPASRYVRMIMQYDREAQRFVDKGHRIIRRYKDIRRDREENLAKYNVLWSNIQTMLPACYAKNPKPQVERRFKDKDPVGLKASQVLERSLAYFMECHDFRGEMRNAVLDRLLPGRGTVWVRYVPHFRDMDIHGNEEIRGEGAQVTDDAYSEVEETPQEVYYEEVLADYVHWEDFGHNVGRTWAEIFCVWRKVYLDREECVERFGPIGKTIPLDHNPREDNKDGKAEAEHKATIYEIWDKRNKTAYWLHKSMPKFLDVRPDPLELPGFFPCPRPLFATLANDSCLPIADYLEYQDQAREMDELTSRISSITKALKVCGVYDASAEGIARLLAEGVENQLIPVDQYAMLREKGGLSGVFELFPMEKIAQTLLSLYQMRDQVKNDLNEISGMPDILRGANDAAATATAERTKAQFGSMRLRETQSEVQRFVRDVLNLMGDIIAKQFSWQTLAEISGIKMLSNQQKQQYGMMMQSAQQGMPAPAQIPPDIEELMQEPSWEDVEALLRNNAARHFRIDIETDSTIGDDDAVEQQSALQFVTTAGQLISQAVQAAEQQPAMAQVTLNVLMFALRRFKQGRSLEMEIEGALEKLVEQSKNPQPSQQQTQLQGQMQIEQMKAQSQAQVAQAKVAADKELAQFKAQMDAQVEQAKQQAQAEQNAQQQQLEAAKAHAQMQNDMTIEQFKAEKTAELEQFKAQLQVNAQIEIARINAEAKIAAANITATKQPDQATLAREEAQD